MTDVREFLLEIEDTMPLAGHSTFKEDWMEDVREYAEDCGIGGEGLQQLEALLAARSMTHAAVVGGTSVAVAVAGAVGGTAGAGAAPGAAQEAWEWLLTAPQVEQRTDAWYAESKNLLTASEVATVFKAGRTRGTLVMAKAAPPADVTSRGSRTAVERSETSPFAWGIRYEPVVKEYLEKSLGATIVDLGRIRHRTVERIAASPDGLITSCTDSGLVGRLVEIKCPSTRIIKGDTIPFEYWCQMQLQMEVCGRPACEYVEAKFREVDGADDTALSRGWITLQCNTDTEENRYIYKDTADAVPQEGAWANVETYGWELVQLRRVTVLRDANWFNTSIPAFEQFWKDVEGAKAGTWILPPSSRVKKEKAPVAEECAIVDDAVADTPVAAAAAATPQP